MPAPSIQTEAFVLTRLSSAEAWTTYILFSVEHGSLHALQRQPSRRTPSHVGLNLFDEVGLGLETANQGRTWFVKEARVIKRHVLIGRSYKALQMACSLSSVIARNPVHEESRTKVAGLLRSAYEAFGASERPDIVYFKGLYRFARDEGYPVKEAWLASLPASLKGPATELLSRPADNLGLSEAEVTRLRRLLEDYLRGHTEIFLD